MWLKKSSFISLIQFIKVKKKIHNMLPGILSINYEDFLFKLMNQQT